MHLAEIANRVLLMGITHDSSKSIGGLGIRQMTESLSTGCVLGNDAALSVQPDLSFLPTLINVFASLSFSSQLSQRLHLATWPASATVHPSEYKWATGFYI